ncbi:hypothetical protein NKI78_19745 [Mesorhizobium sp. M0400]|uniref:hypothetical protein n=1 Tax=Mesorhizobium sp. M0400 TaxID=2956941 RepID=UPI003335C174
MLLRDQGSAPPCPTGQPRVKPHFGAYVDALIGVIGHADRAVPLKGSNKVRREAGKE